jgi:hypothetical protein
VRGKRRPNQFHNYDFFEDKSTNAAGMKIYRRDFSVRVDEIQQQLYDLIKIVPILFGMQN